MANGKLPAWEMYWIMENFDKHEDDVKPVAPMRYSRTVFTLKLPPRRCSQLIAKRHGYKISQAKR